MPSIRLKIPRLFQRLLQDNRLQGRLLACAGKCEEYVGDPTRGMAFFPEYTDHGLAHVQQVLEAAAALVSGCRQPMTPEDAAVLCTAALLHDAAMHLTPDQLLTLLQARGSQQSVEGLGDVPWPEAWQAFYADARRWDDRKLKRVFGAVRAAGRPDPEEVVDSYLEYVRHPEEMGPPDQWPEAYRRFLGEFVRMHHGRLAHEFALYGAPCLGGEPALHFLDGRCDLDDMAGFVARSHTMPLRATFAYLDTRYHGHVTCRNCHPVYLMVLLRIADFLQIDSTRAPRASLQIRRLRSPASRAEWDAHLSVVEVRPDDQDTQAIFVDAKPQEVASYLKLKALLDSLQNELDLSWASLGEVFSRDPRLKRLTIGLRRVRSNIEDEARFGETVSYIPIRAEFRTTGASLLKKLVRPFYGDEPQVGIRELLQNSLDAVRERDQLSQVASVSGPTAYSHKWQIRVALETDEEGGHWVVVEDRGVGMTADTITDYFLTAGASFRESAAWRRDFGGSGEPRVLRSGRFGVGVLAAFLLGKEVQVETRHLSASQESGIAFGATLDDDLIELRKVSRSEPGTTVRVRTDATTYERLKSGDGLSWDWYRFTYPRVLREIEGRELQATLMRLPEQDRALPVSWHKLASPGFAEIHWTYAPAPHLVCNGLVIGKGATHRYNGPAQGWGNRLGIPVAMPHRSVFDPRGLLPLNLQRYGLAEGEVPFSDDLQADVTRDFCAYCLLFAPSEPLCGAKDPRVIPWDYPGYARLEYDLGGLAPRGQWFWTRSGSSVLSAYQLRNMRLEHTLAFILINHHLPFPAVDLEGLDAVFCCVARSSDITMAFFGHAVRAALGAPPQERVTALSMMAHAGARLLIGGELAAAFRHQVPGRADISARRNGFSQGCEVWEVGECRESSAIQVLSPETRSYIEHGQMMVAEWFGTSIGPAIGKPPFVHVWDSMMGDGIIPYDMVERERKYGAALSALSPNVQQWRALAASCTGAPWLHFFPIDALV